MKLSEMLTAAIASNLTDDHEAIVFNAWREQALRLEKGLLDVCDEWECDLDYKLPYLVEKHCDLTRLAEYRALVEAQ